MNGTGVGKRWLLAALCLIGLIGFSSLGVWQLERRDWKLELIDRVATRIHEAPGRLPLATEWARLGPSAFEYRHVRLTGTYEHERQTLVDALTELGAGYWVLTPLRTGSDIVLVNRGFVPREQKLRISRPQGFVEVTGLLRLTEPGGRFLRPNRPATDLWYSRDVVAISKRRRLTNVAPFFIDAQADGQTGQLPVGGLTVVNFRNAHLAYALTWFCLAALSSFGLWFLVRSSEHRDS